MDCERCRVRDGRATKTYDLVAKRQKRVLCDQCAVITQEVHELKPKARVPAARDEAAADEPTQQTEPAASSPAPATKTEKQER